MEPLHRQGSMDDSLDDATLSGRVPVMTYGLDDVHTTSDCPMTPRPTMGKSTDRAYATGHACGR